MTSVTWDVTSEPDVAELLAAGMTSRSDADRLTAAAATVALRSLVDVDGLPVLLVPRGEDLRRLPANVVTGTAWDTAVTLSGPNDGPDVVWFDGARLHVLDVVSGPWPVAPVTDPSSGLLVPADAPDALHARARSMLVSPADDDRASIGLAIQAAAARGAVARHTVEVRSDAERVLLVVTTTGAT